MLKLAFCLRRLPHLSRDEFHRYWYETHAPLVRSHADALAIRRYVQLHTVADDLNAVLRAGRGGPDSYDGIAELWWDDRATFERVLASEPGRTAARTLLEDERRFIDLTRSPLWLADERAIIPRVR